MNLKSFFLLFLLTITLSTLSNGQNADSLKYNNTLDKAVFLYRKGVSYGQNGILDSALLHTQNAILLFEGMQPTDSTGLANAYQSLGIINKILGKYNDAINCYDKSEKIYKAKNNTQLTAYIYGNKANIYSAQQDYSKALDYVLRANDIFKNDSIKFQNQLALAYNNLGNIYRKKEDYVEAINYYNKSLSLKTKNNSLYSTLGNLALCNDKLEKPELANTYYLKAIESIKELYEENNIKATTHYLNYANFLAKQRNNDEALKYFRLTINIYRNNIGEKHPDLSNYYNDLGEFFLKENIIDSALFYFQKSLIALSPNFNNKKISSNPTINDVLSKTRLLSALKNKAYALSELYLLNNDKDYLKLSLASYDQAIETIDLIRSGFLSEESKLFLAANELETFSNALQTSYELFKLTNEQKYLEKAFNYSEAGKSAILNESLKNNHALNIGGIPESLLVKEKDIAINRREYETKIQKFKSQKDGYDTLLVKNYQDSLFNYSRQYDKLMNTLEHNYPEYFNLKYKQETAQVKDIQHELDNNTTLINYFIGDTSLFICAITKEEYKIKSVKIDSLFNEKIIDYYIDIKSNFTEKDLKSSSYFYNYLIEPIKEELKNKDNLIIIPDGNLYYIPFETLCKDDTYSEDLSRLNYLIKNYSVTYHHTATLWLNSKEKEQNQFATKDNFIGFAPVFDPKINNGFIVSSEWIQDSTNTELASRSISTDFTHFNTLPYSENKVESIVKLFNKKRKEAKGFFYKEANEENFKHNIQNYKYIHIASHSFTNDLYPNLSGIAFSQPDTSAVYNEDGILYAGETYNLNLPNADLITLSSCKSGLGKLIQGEGFLSLSRGFLYSGAPNIIFSLWNVKDEPTKDLMIYFYKRVLQGTDYAGALRKAKIKLINNPKTASPKYWGAWILVGR